MGLYEPRTLAESVGGGRTEQNTLPIIFFFPPYEYFLNGGCEYKVRHCFLKRNKEQGEKIDFTAAVGDRVQNRKTRTNICCEQFDFLNYCCLIILPHNGIN